MVLKTKIDSIYSSSLTIGTSTNVDGYLLFDNGQTNKSGIKYNSSTSKIQVSNNGTDWSNIGSADSVVVNGDIQGTYDNNVVVGLLGDGIQKSYTNIQGNTFIKFNGSIFETTTVFSDENDFRVNTNDFPDTDYTAFAHINDSIDTTIVAGIRHTPITNVIPNDGYDGYVLKYKPRTGHPTSEMWQFKPIFKDVVINGDISTNLTNSNNEVTVTGLRGVTVNDSVLSDGYILLYNQSQNKYIPRYKVETVELSNVGGRLSIESGNPTKLVTQTANWSNTLYWTPYKGSKIALYSNANSSWAMYTVNELSITNTALAPNSDYDVYMYLDSGVPKLRLKRLFYGIHDRGHGGSDVTEYVQTKDGVLVNFNTNDRYLGSINAIGKGDGSGYFDNTSSNIAVWNYYNRIKMPISKLAGFYDYWELPGATHWRVWAGEQQVYMKVLIGWEEDTVKATCCGRVTNSTGNAVNVSVGIGINSTIGPAFMSLFGGGSIINPSSTNQITAHFEGALPAGYDTIWALEANYYGGTVEMYGNSVPGPNTQLGLIGSVYA